MQDTQLKPRLDLKTVFVPVIFANGVDDDVPGLVAAIEHKLVQFDDKLYEPREDIEINGRTILLSKQLYVVGCDEPLPDVGDAWVVIRQGNEGRHIAFNNCDFDTSRQ